MRLLGTALILLVSAGTATSLSAQADPRRHTFATSFFGADLTLPGDRSPNGALAPGITIGGTHFWGHADFHISITPRRGRTDYGVFTGGRYYPWQLRAGGIRPYVGYAFAPVTLRLESDRTAVRSFWAAGLGTRTRKWYAYAGYEWVGSPETTIYADRGTPTTRSIPTGLLRVGVNRLIETTYSRDAAALKRRADALRTSHAKGFFVSAGPSSAFPRGDSPYNRLHRPWLDDRAMPGLFPEISLGYESAKAGLILNLAYRGYAQRLTALDFEQSVGRRSVALELLKVLGDYHGFVPFVGGGLAAERYHLHEADAGVPVTSHRASALQPVLTAGWDIRPAYGSEPWLLRTTLRVAPGAGISHQGERIRLNHIEFNFIQFVWYPQRAASR